ncbi:MAG TPA: type II toxin-antitoxin system VapB family antitoxin [Prosthecobacter sp.]|nr:type II toxin-antitoxin system VapB family antitoxin [Prosthecobacter sp.]
MSKRASKYKAKRSPDADHWIAMNEAEAKAEKEDKETMRTNIIMETPLVYAAQEITGIKTKAGVVHHALKELVRRERMKQLLALRGKVAWDGDLDEMRRTREF